MLLALSCSLLGFLAGAEVSVSEEAASILAFITGEEISAETNSTDGATPLAQADDPAPYPVCVEKDIAAAKPPTADVQQAAGDDGLINLAVEGAATAMPLLTNAFAEPERSGWNHHSTRSGVRILTRTAPTGSATWGMGVGEIDAPASVVFAVQEEEEIQRRLDKQHDVMVTLLAVPKERFPQLEAGWEAVELSLVHGRYKSPAWPVGPRDLCAAKLVAYRAADGAIAVTLRSVDLASCPVPAGYVRMALECGGYIAAPTGTSTCTMSYVNMLDPRGSVPAAVVRVTVPDRAMVVDRIRKVVQDHSLWASAAIRVSGFSA